jgi:hypothetical protein
MEEEGETDTGVKSKSWKEINGGRAMAGRPINEEPLVFSELFFQHEKLHERSTRRKHPWH